MELKPFLTISEQAGRAPELMRLSTEGKSL
jgi:hypothetical protein